MLVYEQSHKSQTGYLGKHSGSPKRQLSAFLSASTGCLWVGTAYMAASQQLFSNTKIGVAIVLIQAPLSLPVMPDHEERPEHRALRQPVQRPQGPAVYSKSRSRQSKDHEDVSGQKGH
jgi:hypothetical protein